ncbi:ribonuclease H-like domain-containing protein [Tanacetum coccineum]
MAQSLKMNPNHESVHPMVTRFRVRTNRPTERLNLHVSSVSPLPKSYRDAFIPRPPDTNIMRCMWLFHYKYLADGMLSRNKARLVANGSTQLEGVDVDETFSPIIKPGTIRTVLSLAASRHWPTHQLDKKYAIEILDRAHMLNCNPSRTPIDTESKLGSDGDPVSDSTLYQILAGSIQYLTFTRTYISYEVQQMCLYMHDPREPHFWALKRILLAVFWIMGCSYFLPLQQIWLHIRMRIGLVSLLLVAQLQVTVFFLATTYSLGPLSVSPRFLVLVQRQGTIIMENIIIMENSIIMGNNIIMESKDILGVTIQRAIKEILGDTTQRDIEEILGDTTQRDIEEILGDTTQRDIEEILGDIPRDKIF